MLTRGPISHLLLEERTLAQPQGIPSPVHTQAPRSRPMHPCLSTTYFLRLKEAFRRRPAKIAAPIYLEDPCDCNLLPDETNSGTAPSLGGENIRLIVNYVDCTTTDPIGMGRLIEHESISMTRLKTRHLTFSNKWDSHYNQSRDQMFTHTPSTHEARPARALSPPTRQST